MQSESLVHLFQVLLATGDPQVKTRLAQVAEEIGKRRPVPAAIAEILDFLPPQAQAAVIASIAQTADPEVLKRIPSSRFPQLNPAVRRVLATLYPMELLDWLERLQTSPELATDCLRLCDLEADVFSTNEILIILAIAGKVKFQADRKFLADPEGNVRFVPSETVSRLIKAAKKRRPDGLGLAVVLDELSVLDQRTLFRFEALLVERPGVLAELDDCQFCRILEIFTARVDLLERFRQSVGLVLAAHAKSHRVGKMSVSDLLLALRCLGKLFQRKMRADLTSLAEAVIEAPETAVTANDEIGLLKFFVKFKLGQVNREYLELLIDRLVSKVSVISLEQAACLLEVQCEVEHARDADLVAQRIEQLIEEQDESLSISRRIGVLFALADLELHDKYIDRSTVDFLLRGVDVLRLPLPLLARLVYAADALPVACLSADRRLEITASASQAILHADLAGDRKSLLVLDAVKLKLSVDVQVLVANALGNLESQSDMQPLLLEESASKKTWEADDMMAVIMSKNSRSNRKQRFIIH